MSAGAGNDAVVSFDDEPLILVAPDDRVVGFETKANCHHGDGILHRAFSVLLFDGAGRMLLQRRAANKRLWPLFWSNACCSHPRKGEEIPEAAGRRMKEELGIDVPVRELFKFQYQARFGEEGSENELCTVLIGRVDADVTPNPTEIAETKYVAAESLHEEFAAHPDLYTPWLQMEWERIRAEHWDEVSSLWRTGA